LLRLLNGSLHFPFLIWLGIVAELAGDSYAAIVWMFKIPVIAFTASVGEPGFLQIPDQLTNSTRHALLSEKNGYSSLFGCHGPKT
jgi:hypothetical protein